MEASRCPAFSKPLFFANEGAGCERPNPGQEMF
jgi:hypothetical protein